MYHINIERNIPIVSLDSQRKSTIIVLMKSLVCMDKEIHMDNSIAPRSYSQVQLPAQAERDAGGARKAAWSLNLANEQRNEEIEVFV